MASGVIDPGLAPPLEPRYYHDNFLILCATVEQQYGDLLTREEVAWLAAFRALPEPAQCLYVRLVSRVGPCFRRSKLRYPEIGQVAPVAASLIEAGFLEMVPQLDLEQLDRLFTRPEFAATFGSELPLRSYPSKAALLTAVAQWAQEHCVTGAQLLQLLCEPRGEHVFAVTGHQQVALLQLLFFGNQRQSLTEFVLSDLGISRYYPYTLDRQQRLFAHRAAVDEYRDCGELADIYFQLRELGDAQGMAQLAAVLLEVEPRYQASERRWWRLFNRVARVLERSGELPLAAQLYARSQLHPARERAARVYCALEDWAAARNCCEQMLQEPWGEEELAAAGRIHARVQRKLGGPPAPRRRPQYPRLELQLPAAGVAVERAAAQHLQQQWASVHYVENSLMKSLFGLAFWEQIFAPVAGAFHNPFQSVPSDMYQQGFQARRSEILQARLAELAVTNLAPEMVAAYQRYLNYQNRWLDWRLLTPELLAQSLAIIPAAHLLAIWERMLFDPGESRRGFPDLIALGSEPGDYCMIEVKAPGDALQESQKRWLDFFQQQDVPALVAWVGWERA